MRYLLINKYFRHLNNKRSALHLKININYISYSPSSLSSCPSSNNNTNKDYQIPLFEKEFESKYFEFKNIENHIYKWWECKGYFQPSNDLSKEKFIISMPPPNVTGHLHMGHAMFVTLQDIMIRFHRMRGKSVLWLPGTDHAGIATQLQVEKALISEGSSRKSIGRDNFLKRMWEWKEENGSFISNQMKRLGASADWTRERFTLEPEICNAVTEAFIALHNKGLIYKGNYLVNWCPTLQTAVSDLEVEYSEEMGTLYYFKYMLEDGSGFIPVATTRPETIFGDAAVCVNPLDERYLSLIGKKVRVPMTDRLIPIIGDDYVDIEFGTGALKITPAHDANDYAIGKRHNLESICIMNKDASINQYGGDKYQGLNRFLCRNLLWKDMEIAGLVIKSIPHTQRIPRSQRGGDVIEPMISAQWFMKMDNMANKAIDVVKNKELVIIPDRFEKIWYNWLENIHDWCLSRQLWWGHRIPVYYINGSSTDYVVARSLQEAYEMASIKYKDIQISLVQDEDVLDTWFSSGLWPFATVGWPVESSLTDPTSDYNRFYPSSVMETGYDILFFWVARMVMLGIELTDKSPFHTIYLHGLVRSDDGQKMSKSKGNVIDPLDTIDLYGTDALRFSLVTNALDAGQDIPLSIERIEENRNFVNKLWNIGKYVSYSISTLTSMEKQELNCNKIITKEEIQSFPLAERHIISSLHVLINKVTDNLEVYNFSETGRLINDFLWYEFADWYVEISKTRMKDSYNASISRKVLIYTWDTVLRLLHPIMPYVTEILWQNIPHDHTSIMIATWPLMKDDEELYTDINAILSFKSLQELVRTIRNVRVEYNVPPAKKIGASIRVSKSNSLGANIKTEIAMISLLARLDETLVTIDISDEIDIPVNCVHLVVEDGLEVFIPVTDMIDNKKELGRLVKQYDKLKKEIEILEARINNQAYVNKAPANIVTTVRTTIAENKEQLSIIDRSMNNLLKQK